MHMHVGTNRPRLQQSLFVNVVCIYAPEYLHFTMYYYYCLHICTYQYYHRLYVRESTTYSLTIVYGWETYNLMVGKVVVNVGMQISAVDDVISFKYSVQ